MPIQYSSIQLGSVSGSVAAAAPAVSHGSVTGPSFFSPWRPQLCCLLPNYNQTLPLTTYYIQYLLSTPLQRIHFSPPPPPHTTIPYSSPPKSTSPQLRLRDRWGTDGRNKEKKPLSTSGVLIHSQNCLFPAPPVSRSAFCWWLVTIYLVCFGEKARGSRILSV